MLQKSSSKNKTIISKILVIEIVLQSVIQIIFIFQSFNNPWPYLSKIGTLLLLLVQLSIFNMQFCDKCDILWVTITIINCISIIFIIGGNVGVWGCVAEFAIFVLNLNNSHTIFTMKRPNFIEINQSELQIRISECNEIVQK